jgi:hypothetical protein
LIADNKVELVSLGREVKNPAALAVRREVEEDWSKRWRRRR